MKNYAAALLIANAIWDIVSAMAVWACAVCERPNFIADAHVSLWVDEEDQSNFAANALFAFVLVHWSCLRVAAVTMEWPEIAVWTYGMEALLVLSMVLMGRMHAVAGCAVALLCALCGFVVVL